MKKAGLNPAERLPVIEHKAMIQSPAEAVHHKPVF
jgi:hypothetical protein